VLHLYDKQGIGKNLNDPVKEKRKSEKMGRYPVAFNSIKLIKPPIYEVYSSSGHSGQPFRLSLEYTPIGSHSFNIAFIFSYKK
jgi:hypothetical protein